MEGIGKTPFERRAEEAERRKKIPTEGSVAIEMPDLSAFQERNEARKIAKRFFTLMPGEIVNARPDGGDYIIDDSADVTAPGVFTYAEHIFRPVNSEEQEELNVIMANPETRREKGSRRLSTLLPATSAEETTLPPRNLTNRERVEKRKELEDQLGPAAGRIPGTAQKYWVGDDGSAKIIDDEVAQTVQINGSHGRGAKKRYWHGPNEKWVDEARHNAIRATPTAPTIDYKLMRRVHNSADTTGGPGAGEVFYTQQNPDGSTLKNADGSIRYFTQAEYDQLRAADPANAAAGGGAGGGGPRVPGNSTPNNGPADNGQRLNPEGSIGGTARHNDAERPAYLSMNKRDYIGIKIKPLSEIIHTDRYNQLFGELMTSMTHNGERSAEIMARASQDGDLTPDEHQLIHYAQLEFSKRLKDWEDMSKHITVAELERLSSRDGRIDYMVDKNTPEVSVEILKEELLHRAMTDRELFMQGVNAFKGLNNRQNRYRYQMWEAKVQNLAQRAGITMNEFDAAFDLSTPEGRAASEAYIAEKIHENAGNFRKSMDWISKRIGANVIGSSGNEAFQMMQEADKLNKKRTRSRLSPTSKTVSEVNGHLDTITRVVGLTLTDKAVARGITRGVFEKKNIVGMEREMGPKTGEQLNTQKTTVNEQFSQANMQRQFDEAKSRARDSQGRTFDQWDEPAQRDFRDQWNPPGTREAFRGFGVWAMILRALGLSAINERKQKLSLGNAPAGAAPAAAH